MNETPVWFKLFELLLPSVGGVGLFLLGKATKSGANQVVLDGLTRDMKTLQDGYATVLTTQARQGEIVLMLKESQDELLRATRENSSALARIEGRLSMEPARAGRERQ